MPGHNSVEKKFSEKKSALNYGSDYKSYSENNIPLFENGNIIDLNTCHVINITSNVDSIELSSDYIKKELLKIINDGLYGICYIRIKSIGKFLTSAEVYCHLDFAYGYFYQASENKSSLDGSFDLDIFNYLDKYGTNWYFFVRI